MTKSTQIKGSNKLANVFLPFYLLLFVYFGFAQTPTVTKVEPPSWWAGHTINPVRLLVRGTDLRNARVTSKNTALKVSNVRANERGDYLFFDVTIAKNARVGKYEFDVSTGRQKTAVPFEILAPLGSKNNFQGITNEDVIYLIMTDRFADGDASNNSAVDRTNPRMWHGGDLRGVTEKLPYLKELGVTAIWLTPWYDNPDEVTTCDKPWCPMASYHGYGATDYYAVENHFGTFRDLRNFIETAHRNGLKVIQDQVANHVSFRHPWVKNPPLDNWFPPFTQNRFNDSVLLSPYATQAERDNVLKGWFDFSLPDMNHDEPEVVKYQIQNALWWIGTTGIDGIRQDTIQYMPRKFIRDWSTAIKKQYPRFWMVGEIFEEDAVHTAFFQGGKTGVDGIDTNLPSVFDFSLWRTSQEVFTGKKPARALRDVLKYDTLYPNVNNVTLFANNHDTDRFMSLQGATKDGAKLHIAFVLATRGIPQLYAGEEILMEGGHDPDNRRDFAGGFTGDGVNKFVKEGRTADEQEMFEWTRRWINLRKENPALKTGHTLDLFYDNEIYVFARLAEGLDRNKLRLMAFNASNREQSVTFSVEQLSEIGLKTGRELVVIIGDSNNLKLENGVWTMKLPPKSAAVYGIR